MTYLKRLHMRGHTPYKVNRGYCPPWRTGSAVDVSTRQLSTHGGDQYPSLGAAGFIGGDDNQLPVDGHVLFVPTTHHVIRLATMAEPPMGCTSNGWSSSSNSPDPRSTQIHPAIPRLSGNVPMPGHGSERQKSAVGDTSRGDSENRVNGSDTGSYQLWHTLPKLPVPKLQSTMDKYLSLVKTVVSPEDYARTQRIVTDFCKPQGLGQQLQDYLLSRQQQTDNWALDWWLHDMYLNIKLPLIINSNPAAVFPYQRFPSRRHQVRFTAKFVCGMLDFKTFLDRRTLPIERCKYKEKGQPLCMEQHYRLFNSYRQPGHSVDVQRTDLQTEGNEHIVVACNNQFYKVEVSVRGDRICEADLCLQLARILNMAEKNNQSPEVGVLTSQSRDVWAEHRDRLLEDETNRLSLQTLETCLFLVCLDKPTVPSFGCSRKELVTDLTARTHHILHGQGVSNNTCNRWMDKTIQLIVSEDGTCGINMEHSVAEGIALGHMVEHTFSVMGKEKAPSSSMEPDRIPAPSLLMWNLSSQSLADVRTARQNVDRLVEDLDLCVYRFEGFGRDFIKCQNMSPDAFIQLSLQLTYYKIHASLTSTYESASVRRFRLGRVDVIRANSQAALTWIRAMLGQTDNTEEEKLRLLTDAINWQQEYTMNTVLGHGIDLHLLGLREAAAELGMPTPDLFTDPSNKEFNTFRLSTSQVPTVSDYWMGYGAVVPDGYGVCYNPQPDYITFSVASFFSCMDTSSDMFVNSLESSLLQMAELCTYDPENSAIKQR